MKKNKRWIAITALTGVTAAALITAVVVKNNLNKGPEDIIAMTQAGTDLGIKQIEVLKGSNGEITGYKVNVEAKGFGATPMELAVSFSETADTVTGVEVIAHSETEGYGANMTQPEFLDQFKNVKLPVYIEGMSISSNDVLQVLSLATNDAATVTTASSLVDGTYEVVGEPDAKGYTSQVTLTVEGGKITGVVWDCVDADGKLKSTMSQNGEYVMTEDGATWYEQAQLLAQNVIENQGVAALTMNADGKTDVVASVSITISEFVAQVQEAMEMASKEKPSAVTLKDGVYDIVGEPDAKGYTSQVTLTVEGGKITSVVWDCVDADGKLKSTMSQNGEYVMTEDGATWYEQAQLLAQNVIENQGVSALAMNADGKTDAVASVSITISEFVAQVQEALEMASKEEPSAVVLKDGVFEIVGEPDAKGYTSQVTLTVEGGKITAVVWDCVDAKGKLKSTMSQNGEYVMTEDGATWYEQAQLLAQNVIENQGVAELTMDADGKTDAIASVSITIDEFVSQVEQALVLSAGGETPVVEEPTTEEPVTESPVAIDGTKVDAISGATISTKAFLTAINNAYDYLVNNVVE